MTDIAAAALGSFGRQRNELIGFGEGRWRVDERGSDTERALLHGLSHKSAHPRQLLGGRVDIPLAKLVLADGCCADERSHVHGRAAALHQAEIFAERRPFYRIFEVALLS